MIKNIKIGDIIGNQIEIIDIYGGTEDNDKSSFGIVYIGKDSENRIFAMKTFQDKFINDENQFKSFKKESLEWVKLKYHPNVVKAYGVEFIDNRPFLLMEAILPNEELKQKLTHYLSDDLPLKTLIDWSIQFCYGMEFINENGIISHGDIKPDNILIDFLGYVKITDFGLLNLSTDLNIDDYITGSLPYMAPESFNGTNNIQTDIYSFGVVLYQLNNFGKLPFLTEHNLLKEWLDVHSIHEIPTTNNELNSVITKCLEKDIKKRYTTFKELRHDLENLFLELYKTKPYYPNINEISEELQLSVLAQSYAEYGEIELFNECSEIIKKSNNKKILMEHAIVLIKIGDYEDAITLLNRVIGDIDNFDEKDRAYFNIGHAYHELNRLYDAENYYLECLKNNADFIIAKVNLGNVYRNIGNFDKALHYYDEALKIDCSFYEAIYNKAILFAKMGKIEESNKLYSKIENDKENPALFLDKSLPYFDSNKNRALLELYPSIKDENNVEDENLVYAIRIYISKGQIELADERFEELMKKSDDDYEIKLQIAEMYFEYGYIEKFQNIIEEIKNTGTDYEKYETLIFESYLIANDNPKKSLKICDEIIYSDASNEQKSGILVNKFILTNNITYLNQALVLNSFNEIAYINYIAYFENRKEWSNALKISDKGLDKFPNSQKMLFLKGKLYFYIRNFVEAVKYFKLALETNLPTSEIQLYTSISYACLDDEEKFNEHFEYAKNLAGFYDKDVDLAEIAMLKII